MVDTNNPNLLIHINEKDFNTLENFHPIFTNFSNIVECLINFNQSKNRLLNFIDNTCKHPISSTELIYPDFKFLFSSNALFGRILIDNVKSNFNQLEIPLTNSIDIFEKRNEFKMMRVLRDFGLHFSSPINDMLVNLSPSSNMQTLSILTLSQVFRVTNVEF